MRINTFNDKGYFVGQIKNWSQIRIGNKNVTVFQGEKLIYPKLN